MKNKGMKPRTTGFAVSREEEIFVIREMAIAARNGSAAMKLDFAAYLLDMVVLSLSDHIGEDAGEKHEL